MTSPGADPPRSIFITGATGFIGSRLARLLVEDGHRLRCLVRPGSRVSELRALGAELVTGDVVRTPDLVAGLAGVDLAYHLAGAYRLGPGTGAELQRVNVEGTRAFLEALRRAGTPHAVYASTVLALGPQGEAGATGVDRVNPGPYASHYERTKSEAHRLALEARAGGQPLTVVCPAYVYGPGDEGPAGTFLRDLKRGLLPALPRRTAWFSFVHVDDVARGFLQAGTRGPPGAGWVLSGEPASFEDFAVRAARALGRTPPRLRLPGVLIEATGTALDVVSRATGVRFPITREGAATVGSGLHWTPPPEEASRGLGWEPRPLDVGLAQTVATL